MTDELAKIKIELAQARADLRVRDQKISELNVEIQDVRGKLQVLQRQRPKLSPQNLIASFGSALSKMQEGLETSEGRIDYIVSNLDIELKTAITLDDEGNINFQLPQLEDIIPQENLSRMNLTFKSVPKPTVPPPETREVPGVIGLAQEKAAEVLSAAGFKAGTVTEKLSSTPAGTVIGQDPERFTYAPEGIAVDLVVSKVLETKVPNLVGLSKENAFQVLAADRLQPGEISAEISDSPPGTVIRQGIKAGSAVPVDTLVDLVIAKPEMVSVPEVVGSSLSVARRALNKGKLKVGQVSEETSSKPKGTVLKQDPQPGIEILAGSQVNLVVSKLPFVVVPELKGMKRAEAEQVLKKASLKVGKIIRRKSRKPRGTVIGQNPKPGEALEAGKGVNITVASPGRVPRAPK